MNLYEIDAGIRSLCEELEINGGELTPEMEEAFDGLTQDRITKLDNILAYRQQLEGEASVYDAEIKRLQELKKSKSNSADRLKEYVYQSMKAMDEVKHDLPRFKVWRQGTAAGVRALPEDISTLPSKYLVPQPDAVDKKGIITDWNNGVKLPDGVIVEKGETLRIK